jgi:hypothetical protein
MVMEDDTQLIASLRLQLRSEMKKVSALEQECARLNFELKKAKDESKLSSIKEFRKISKY